ncbi:cytochrome P450 [Punctularia strigosozonata HHB-11173 SS5]|uniref:cytochrome P450 n=1 Tax=Punctularia strigosozonata (strain HHB-11173) TaxID=741275 RepID=UPI0004418607|nr:cytochrome P450 [Punctularia strigosozonata HHB-11173 SS5]EIN09200.1 cytochrome P450 [Punctularia strigosozonata HHB-11173 SS5]
MDAISMTMFMHDCSASGSEIRDLLHKITNAPGAGDDVGVGTMLAGAVISKVPRLFPILPSPMKKWADHLRTRLGSVAERVWQEGATSSNMDAKILDLLDKQGKDSEEGLTKEEAIAQIIGILFAGSETVANVISELFLELARQPRIQDKLRDELLEFERRTGGPPKLDDLTSPTALPYLEAVTREVLRVKAVLMVISRAAAGDDVIPLQYPVPGTGATELHVKAGQSIMIPVRDGVNVDPKLWGDDAAVFRPERWLEPDGLPEGARSIRAQGHTLTFGDGPKVCLGRNFALAELKIIVSVVTVRFRFEESGAQFDFYHLGGNTVKPTVRGSEAEGVQLPLRVHRL